MDIANTIVDNLYVGVYITDADGRTIYINKTYENMSRLPRRELIGKRMEELVRQKYFNASATLLVLKTKKPAITTFTTKTNRKLLSHGKPVFDQKDNIVLVVNTVYDISEFNKYINYSYRDNIINNADGYESAEIIARSSEMLKIIDLAVRISDIDSTVLITGESGVGKEIIARLIHSLSKRKNKPFIKVNCAAIPGNLIESELFGYEGGAFTGSKPKGKKGIFEEANHSTIFLDEIGEMPLDVQTKLLQVLQDKEFTKIGAVKPTRVDVKIIAATNEDLREMVENKTFREDLYYRLNVIPINIPPLRERREDIEPLTRYIVDRLNAKYNLKKSISDDLIELFTKLPWKGNVRELENTLERLTILTEKDVITRNDYFLLMGRPRKHHRESTIRDLVNNYEREILIDAASRCKNLQEIAERLGVSRSTALRKLRKHNIKFQK